MSQLAQELPPSLKRFRKFLLNAVQADKIRPVAGYQARLYVAKQLMQGDKTPESQAFLRTLLGALEETPLEVRSKPEVEAEADVTDFAMSIFSNAHKEDSEGRASKRTVTAFMTAWVFFETLKNFGERDSDIEEKAKYCLFKAKDITDAIREGRKPTPGNPFDTSNEQQFEETSLSSQLSQESDAVAPAEPTHVPSPVGGDTFPQEAFMQNPRSSHSTPPSQVNFIQASSDQYHYEAPAHVRNATAASGGAYPIGNDPAKKPHPAPGVPTPLGSYSEEDKVRHIMEAEKLTKHAMAAMRFSDTHTAVEKLREVILLLMPYSSSN
ncbi:MAG: hypothetical protein MHM6MM_001500 [Cercozoa sp. M6MM]